MVESQKRLATIIEKKLKTTFIGCLSEFETFFGDLWGHDSNEELSEEQKVNLRKWLLVRENILDSGNTQIRALKKELCEYDIKWNRYVMKFKVGGQNET